MEKHAQVSRIIFWLALALAAHCSNLYASASFPVENPYTAQLKRYEQLLQQEQQSGSTLGDFDLATRLINKLDNENEAASGEELTAKLAHFDPKVKVDDGSKFKIKKALGPKGDQDPHFPQRFTTKPLFFAMPAELNKAMQFDLKDGQISIENITLASLKRLSDQQLQMLISYFDSIPLKLQWRDINKRVRSGKKKFEISPAHTAFPTSWIPTTAAGVLAFAVGMQHDPALLTKIMVMTPGSAVSAIAGEGAAIVSTAVAANAIVELLKQLNQENTGQVAQGIAGIAGAYISYRSENFPGHLILSLVSLIRDCNLGIQLQSQAFNNKQKGLLLGALLSGALSHADNLNSSQHSLWLVNTIATLIWATNTFMNLTAISSPIFSTIAGVMSAGVVIWIIVKNGRRKYNPTLKIREIEGYMESAALEIALNREDKYKVGILEILAWMRTSLHLNGTYD